MQSAHCTCCKVQLLANSLHWNCQHELSWAKNKRHKIKNAAKRSRQHAGKKYREYVYHQSSSCTEGCLPLKVVFNQRTSSTGGHLTLKVVFHLRSSSTYHNTLIDLVFVRSVRIPNFSFLPALEVAFPPKVVFHKRSSSTGGSLPPKIVFLQRSSSTIGRLPPQVVFQRRLSSTEGCLPPKVVFHLP